MGLGNIMFGLTAAAVLCGCGGGAGSSPPADSNAGPTATSSPASSTASTSSSNGLTSGSSSGSGSGSIGSATLSWTPPTVNTNGTALTDLAGFHIHYGTTSSSLTQEVDVPTAGAASYTITGLGTGTWYFAVSAYTTGGVESGLSAVGSKTIS